MKSENRRKIELLERLYSDHTYQKPVTAIRYREVNASKSGDHPPRPNAYVLTRSDRSQERIERQPQESYPDFEKRVDAILTEARSQVRRGDPVCTLMPCQWMPKATLTKSF